MVGQRDAGIYWLHVHPQHIVPPEIWEVVRLARAWGEGHLPEPGGVQDQSAWTVAAIEVVTNTWSRMRQAEWDRKKQEG